MIIDNNCYCVLIILKGYNGDYYYSCIIDTVIITIDTDCYCYYY